MEFLPTQEARVRLVDELGALIAARGEAPFLNAPLVLPDETHFPDPWTPDAKGIWRLTERVMAFAGLSHLTSVIRVMDEDQMPEDNIFATFNGILNDKCFFLVRADLIDTPMRLAAIMAHEVAHAYRAHHQLDTEEPEEELQTDLTTVYLGMGILTLAASYRYAVKGELVGITAITTWSHENLGYLSMQEKAYLLALQLRARSASEIEIDTAFRFFGPNPAACLRAALKNVGTDSDRIRKCLRIPRFVSTKKNPIPSRPARSLDEQIHILYDAASSSHEEEKRRTNKSLPIFRVQKNQGMPFFWIGLFSGIISAAFLWKHFVPFADTFLISLWVVTVTFLAFWFGRRRTFDLCSEPECEKVLPPDAAVCPRCGGKISGTVKRSVDRLAAREALMEKRLGNLMKKK